MGSKLFGFEDDLEQSRDQAAWLTDYWPDEQIKPRKMSLF